MVRTFKDTPFVVEPYVDDSAPYVMGKTDGTTILKSCISDLETYLPNAKEFYPDQKKCEMVLIQGIIDAYFEEDGEIIVLDYKTDRVQTEAELKDRYQEQLRLYTKALEQITRKKVKEQIIYSFTLCKEIHLEGYKND